MFQKLNDLLDGELQVDLLTRKLYSTDASVYQQIPAAVAFPKSDEDVCRILRFANEHGLGVIPRTAGTSLAGQVVGPGLVVDVSRHLNQIREINASEEWVRVQPGVVRNELNFALAPHGMLFGPETATANRAMIGGMVGNNSCGSNSIVYGDTRSNTIEVSGYLADGSPATFGPLTKNEFVEKCKSTSGLEYSIYQFVNQLMSDGDNRKSINAAFPKASIARRNTGYALDRLMDCEMFGGAGPFNMCQLICGSEGTLFFATDIKLACHPLPPPRVSVICGHFATVDQALQGAQVAMRHQPTACELIDHHIIKGASQNLQQRENLGFVRGEPGAILAVEFRGATDAKVEVQVKQLQDDLKSNHLGYEFPVLKGDETTRVWELRRAGLGVLSNLPGDAKPVAVIEDTAVDLEDLPNYIRDLDELLHRKYNSQCVHYAHAGSGELHLRPVLNLKEPDDRRKFRAIAQDVAHLVKRYRGSLSGEHGDGRLRGEFLIQMVGEQVYQWMQQIKATWDPKGILNPGKIIDTPPMDQALRYQANQIAPEIKTFLNFHSPDILRSVEMCNGSGDCRKTELSGGTMCPSYMATRNEKDTPRARANLMRQVFSEQGQGGWQSEELDEVMDLCLGCKGCKRECPSNVDVAKLKAEFLYQSHSHRGVPLRTRLLASFPDAIFKAPRVVRGALEWLAARRGMKRLLGIHPNRSLPKLSSYSFRAWFENRDVPTVIATKTSPIEINLFCDEFTNRLEPHLGIATVELFESLGYRIKLPQVVSSGRVPYSLGRLKQARSLAENNVRLLEQLVSPETPLIGIEPSAILMIRDEYIDLVGEDLRAAATELGRSCLTLPEFFCRELDAGRVLQKQFTNRVEEFHLHGHCHEKAAGCFDSVVRMLQTPSRHRVRVIPSGCCGMAGAFGFEREHFDVSMQVGELVLFPKIRQMLENETICASGTSCRHQILDGTGIQARHPVEVLRDAILRP